MLGSVADHISRTVAVPVMLIRPQYMQQTKTKERLISNILIPLDGSELGKLALPVGEDLAAKLNVRITLFRMVTKIIPYVTDMAGGAYVAYSKFDQAEEQRVRAEMAVLEKQLLEKRL